MTRRHARAPVAVLAILALTGLTIFRVPAAWVWAQAAQDATGAQASPDGDMERLRERASAFWAAKVAGDSKGQWELLEPRGRARLTPQDYATGQGVVKYLAYQVEDATVKGPFATVKVRLIVQIVPPTVQRSHKVSPSGALIEDKWVRVSGVWYRSLEQETADSINLGG